MAESQHPRLMLQNFLSFQECKVCPTCSNNLSWFPLQASKTVKIIMGVSWLSGSLLVGFVCNQELEFIHKSCCTVGYRPDVFSTTLSHLIATNSSHLFIPFVPIRGITQNPKPKAQNPTSYFILQFTLLHREEKEHPK